MTIRTVTLMALLAALAPTVAAAEGARTCNDAVAKCQLEGSNKPNIPQRCAAAGAQCRKTGVFVGPVTGRKWNIPNR
jgi:hypothetical protein